MRRFLSMLLLAALTLGALGAFGVTASETPSGTPITTVEEFLAMSDSGVYYLANDLDFSGKTYTSTVYNKAFRGVFDGNGHALLNITVSGTNSDAGVFGNLFCGTLRNLTFGSAEKPVKVHSTGGQYSVAAIAGTMTDGATIENVTVYGNASARRLPRRLYRFDLYGLRRGRDRGGNALCVYACGDRRRLRDRLGRSSEMVSGQS